jgi:hypothetical protein
MNRELKFRAWYNNKFHYNIEKHHVEHHAMSGMYGEVWDFSDWLKYAKVQQYIGFRDVKGEQIYEGDIVKFGDDPTSRLYKVVYISPSFSLIHASANIEDYNKTIEINSMDIRNHLMVVAGNIFENPELLKQ